MMIFKPGNVLEVKTDGQKRRTLPPNNIAQISGNGSFLCLSVGPEPSPSAQSHPQRYQGTERPAD